MKLRGARILIEELIHQGVTTVFGYPGGAVLDIYDELYKCSDRIDHVITAHEQGACHAADGYARTSGKVGVVIATSGPGATNLVTGIANANLDSVPLVAITGNVATSALGRDSFQEVDIVGITQPIVKHNFMVRTVAELEQTIKEAFKIANSGRKGPVLIDIPKNVQVGECEYGIAVLPQMPEKPMLAYNREAVLEAARRLSYVPNANGRRLRAKQSRTIGLFLNAMNGEFYGVLADTMNQVCRSQGYELQICIVSNLDSIRARLQWLALDGAMLLMSLFPQTREIWVRCVYYALGIYITTGGVAFLFHTYFMPEAYELFVKEIAESRGWELGKVKTIYDITSCIVSVILSFLFFGFGHFEGVKGGTFIGALLNGWLIGKWGKVLDRYLEFKDGLPLRGFFQS